MLRDLVMLVCVVLLLIGSGCRKGNLGIPVGPRAKAIQRPTSPPAPVNSSVDGEAPSAVTTPAEEDQADSPGVLYADSFADVNNAIKRNIDGVASSEGPPSTRQVYFFLGKPEGSLTLQSVEDQATLGPDGQPGVLALSWQEIPPALPYSGFAYLGRTTAAKRLALVPLQQARVANDLAGMRLKFRLRGLNSRSEMPASFSVGCRLEPTLPDSYNKRLDLGSLAATDEWGTFDVALANGKNLEAFLRAIADESPTGFKLLWAQSGSIKSYHAGDTLLIDDIEFVRSVGE